MTTSELIIRARVNRTTFGSIPLFGAGAPTVVAIRLRSPTAADGCDR